MKPNFAALQALIAPQAVRCHDGNVSPLIHRVSGTSGYGLDVRDAETPEGTAFADLLRAGRAAATPALKQDDVINNTSVSRSTYLRWEGGDVSSRPDLKQVREVCLFIGINPTQAAVALGLCTADEINPSPSEPEFDPVALEIGRILADRSHPESHAALTRALESAVSLWRMAVAMPEPHEPGRSELTR